MGGYGQYGAPGQPPAQPQGYGAVGAPGAAPGAGYGYGGECYRKEATVDIMVIYLYGDQSYDNGENC